jgi:mono/diheme cytochrome c family protein
VEADVRRPASAPRAPTIPCWRRRTALALLTVVVAIASACGHEFEPPDREARVADAAERFQSARFDTITWADERTRELEGNGLYAAKCRNCHGTLGEGGTPYAVERGLSVPSLVQADWRYASYPDSVLFHVFVGHAAGMPSWGVSQITLREMDAVTFYIMERLRPEVLGEEG